MKLSPSRSSLAVRRRPSVRLPAEWRERSANDFVRDKFVGRRTGIKGADLGGAAAVAAIAVVSGSASICGRGRLFCGLTQRGGASEAASECLGERQGGRVSDGFCCRRRQHYISQLLLHFRACSGQCSDERAWRRNCWEIFKWSVLKASSFGRKRGAT